MATNDLELPSAQLPDAPAHDPHPAVEKPWRPRINTWIVAMTVTLATFMEVRPSIANVALPHIAGGLGATQDEATWFLTAYLVANAIILPAGAYMTTSSWTQEVLHDLRRALGKLRVCGFALAAYPYLLQGSAGVGGGGLAPSEQAILADTFPPRNAVRPFAMYGLAVVCRQHRVPLLAATSPTTSIALDLLTSTSPSACWSLFLHVAHVEIRPM